eukprot:scaffold156215_cov21-Prasinocladus_malaysianus.AAC.1
MVSSTCLQTSDNWPCAILVDETEIFSSLSACRLIVSSTIQGAYVTIFKSILRKGKAVYALIQSDHTDRLDEERMPATKSPSSSQENVSLVDFFDHMSWDVMQIDLTDMQIDEETAIGNEIGCSERMLLVCTKLVH